MLVTYTGDSQSLEMHLRRRMDSLDIYVGVLAVKKELYGGHPYALVWQGRVDVLGIVTKLDQE